jgi:hypothetical protein
MPASSTTASSAAADCDDVVDGERLAVEQAGLGADALLRIVH